MAFYTADVSFGPSSSEPSKGGIVDTLWAIMAGLVFVAGFLYRRRLREMTRGRRSRDLSDEEVRLIERFGALEREDATTEDGPLDMRAIEEAEEEFWEETWDEPESWRANDDQKGSSR